MSTDLFLMLGRFVICQALKLGERVLHFASVQLERIQEPGFLPYLCAHHKKRVSSIFKRDLGMQENRSKL